MQINAAAECGLRPPIAGEPLVTPWYGAEVRLALDDLAAWLATNGRPL